jgi:hypothetical protein
MKKNKILILCVISLLLIHFSLVLKVIVSNSPTCDEIAHHVASGYSYIKTGDFRLNPANPPLMRMISAAPLLFLKLNAPFADKSWEEGNSPVFGRQFFYEVNHNADQIIFWARYPMALLSLFLGLLVFLWSRKLFGNTGGLLSLSLYAFSPNIIAFAGLATVDFGAALFNFTAIFSYWRYLRRPSRANLIISGITFGLAVATKYTNVILVPLFILLALCTWWEKRRHAGKQYSSLMLAKSLFFIYFVGLIVLFATYHFDLKPLLKGAPDVSEKIAYIHKFADLLALNKIGLTGERLVYFAQNIPIPFSTYIVGFLGVAHQLVVGMDTFLLGKHSVNGFWYYFLVVFLVKSTLPVIILFALSLLTLYLGGKRKMFNKIFLLIPVVFLLTVASRGKVQIGLRHILSIYPLIFVFIGSLSLLNFKKWIKIILCLVICFFQVRSLLSVYPYPLSYFNEAVNGPDNGYKVLRDSNVDWGHGLKALSQYLKDNGIGEVKLYYFGTADPAYYGIHYEIPDSSDFEEPSEGVYAISAQYLEAFSWTNECEPVAKIAHSIFIYKF